MRREEKRESIIEWIERRTLNERAERKPRKESVGRSEKEIIKARVENQRNDKLSERAEKRT